MDETIPRTLPLEDYLDLSHKAALFYAYIDFALECETEGELEDARSLYRGANEAMRELLSRVYTTPGI
jgi:hypothetical protein